MNLKYEPSVGGYRVRMPLQRPHLVWGLGFRVRDIGFGV